jgi:hypothetical protein
MTRHKAAFGALVLILAAHSVEEYVSRLWETLPPARFLTGLVSQDQERGFLLISVALVAFGAWCFVWPIRRDWPTATVLGWTRVTIEGIKRSWPPALVSSHGRLYAWCSHGTSAARRCPASGATAPNHREAVVGPRLIGNFISRRFSPSPTCERVWRAGQHEPRTLWCLCSSRIRRDRLGVSRPYHRSSGEKNNGSRRL